jgi:hypothetical protein
VTPAATHSHISGEFVSDACRVRFATCQQGFVQLQHINSSSLQSDECLRIHDVHAHTHTPPPRNLPADTVTVLRHASVHRHRDAVRDHSGETRTHAPLTMCAISAPVCLCLARSTAVKHNKNQQICRSVITTTPIAAHRSQPAQIKCWCRLTRKRDVVAAVHDRRRRRHRDLQVAALARNAQRTTSARRQKLAIRTI